MQISNIFSYGRKMTLLSIVSALLGVSLMISPAASAISIGGPSDCDSNAIVRCGTHSTAALVNTYQSDAYAKNVFGHFGISNADIANLNSTNVAGRVTKDGKVFVDGQSRAVAHDAITAGRQNIAGSKRVNAGGATFYQRPPSVSFQQQSLPAFVSMKDGKFQFAVIASCGNPVKATPAKPPVTAIAPAKPVSRAAAKPAPQPAPTQTQSQSQSQSQSVNVHNSNTTTVQNAPQQPKPRPQQPATAPSTDETQPSKLVNSGPASLVGVFLASSIAGAYGFRRYLTNRIG